MFVLVDGLYSGFWLACEVNLEAKGKAGSWLSLVKEKWACEALGLTWVEFVEEQLLVCL